MKTSALRKSIRDYFFRDNKVYDSDFKKRKISKTMVYVQTSKQKKNGPTSNKIHARQKSSRCET